MIKVRFSFKNERSTNASSFDSKRSKEQGVRHKCRSLFLWLAPCRALRSVPIMGTEIVTAHSVRLFRPRIACPYDSPYLHHLPKDPIVRVFFLSSRADGGDKGSAPMMTRFSRQSGCTLLCSALALRRGRTHVLGGSPSGSVADARSRAL